MVTKGFMEREMRYAQEMREPLGGMAIGSRGRVGAHGATKQAPAAPRLENLLAKAKAEKAGWCIDPSFIGVGGPLLGAGMMSNGASVAFGVEQSDELAPRELDGRPSQSPVKGWP